MKLKEKLLQIKKRLFSHPIIGWLTKHRRPFLVSLSVVLLTTLALILFLTLKPTKTPPYTATYRVETQTTFGDIYQNQTEKVIVSRLGSSWKSERFVNDIALLASTYNTPEGFSFCSQNEDEDFDCRRLGDALTKNVGRPPKIDGLKKSSPISQKINIAGQDRACHETTYTLPTATDPNALIQNLTASVCLDDKLQIPLTASLTAHYRVNDITELKDLTIEQTRTLTNLDIAPTLSTSDFIAPTPK